MVLTSGLCAVFPSSTSSLHFCACAQHRSAGFSDATSGRFSPTGNYPSFTFFQKRVCCRGTFSLILALWPSESILHCGPHLEDTCVAHPRTPAGPSGARRDACAPKGAARASIS